MENKSNDKKHAESKRGGKMKKFLNRYGIAVALFACAAIVAGTWLFTDGNILGTKPSATPAPTATKSQQSSVNNGQTLPEAMQSANAQPVSSAAAKLLPDLTKPVKGSITKKFAMDTLVYMKTLNQWSTHSGVDLAGKAGDDVVAALKGTVDSIYSDPMLGTCVKIKCANDVVCVYANLAKTVSVKKGDTVEAGEVIGQIGDTAASETTEDAHLHFEVTVKGAPADPTSYFKS